MNHPWMLITGCSMLGYLLPEILAAHMKAPVPIMMNVITSTACGLIAASFV